nr:C40 family peptidase [Pontibacter liquoris]
MRAETSDRAEIVTQMLFGECYQVVSRQDNWVCIELASDGYRGWIDWKQHNPVSEAYYQAWKAAAHPRVADLMQFVHKGEVRIPVALGAYLPFFDGTQGRVGEEVFSYQGLAFNPASGIVAEKVVEVAHNFLKAPYLWGGKSVFGIDCSGLVQQVYGLFGYQLPRDAWQQVEHGQEVHFVTQTQPGDLAYFANTEGRITHVGLMLEGQQIMHAHGEVRIDTLDHQGIYNNDFQRYTHNLRLIKRIF